MTIHYAYRITRLVDDLSYMGIRSCFTLPELDLGIKYFSSSSNKEFQSSFKNNPKSFKIKVIEIFKTREEALVFEIKYHLRLNVGQNPKFANVCPQTSIWFDASNTVVVRKKNSNGEYFRIACDLYYEDKNIWETPASFLVGSLNGNFGNTVSQFNKDSMAEKNRDKVVVKNQLTGEVSKVSKQEFKEETNLVGVAASTVAARDKDTGDYSRVTKEEFAKNDNLVGTTKGRLGLHPNEVYIFDTVTRTSFYVSKEDYEKDKDRYHHSSLNMINCIDIKTGESSCVPREEFESKDFLVGTRRRIKCPICQETGIGKAFRKNHFKNCKENNEN